MDDTPSQSRTIHHADCAFPFLDLCTSSSRRLIHFSNHVTRIRGETSPSHVFTFRNFFQGSPSRSLSLFLPPLPLHAPPHTVIYRGTLFSGLLRLLGASHSLKYISLLRLSLPLPPYVPLKHVNTTRILPHASLPPQF